MKDSLRWGTWSDKRDATWHVLRRVTQTGETRPACYHATRVKLSPVRSTSELTLNPGERVCPQCQVISEGPRCDSCLHPVAEHYDLGCIHEFPKGHYCKCTDAWRDEMNAVRERAR